jgi:hypothetical protein
MDKKQYNNIIDHSVKYDIAAKDDSLQTARTVFNNMGVAFPQGDMKEVYQAISSNNYMGWRECTFEKAQELANKGIATIGINDDGVIVILAEDSEQTVATTASIMSMEQATGAVSGMQYYAYTAGSTGGNNPVPYRTEVVIQKDKFSGMTTVFFAVTGKTWYCIEWDLVNGDKQHANYDGWLLRSNYNYFSHYYLDIDIDDIDVTPKTYTFKELKLLYAINPYGVAAYVERYAFENLGLTDALNYKDDIFRAIYGRAPRYFGRYSVHEWRQVTSYSDRTKVISEAELIFGMHVVYDEFTIFDVFTSIVDILLALATKIPSKLATVANTALIFFKFLLHGEESLRSDFISLGIEGAFKDTDPKWPKLFTVFSSFSSMLESIVPDFDVYTRPLDYCYDNDDYIVYVKFLNGKKYRADTISNEIKNIPQTPYM